eukprot:5678493-Pyramimonas_sp.AAC.1
MGTLTVKTITTASTTLRGHFCSSITFGHTSSLAFGMARRGAKLPDGPAPEPHRILSCLHATRVKAEPGVTTASEAPTVVKTEAPASTEAPSAPGCSRGVGSDASSVSADGSMFRAASDKAFYNKFNYRIKTADQSLKDEYARLVTAGNKTELEQFMTTVIEAKGKYTDDFLRRYRAVEDESAQGSEGGWISWKQACMKEDEDALLEMVQSGAITSRRSHRLSADTKVPFPRHLEVYYSQEVFSKKRRVQDRSELGEAKHLDDYSHEDFVKQFAHARVQNNVPTAANLPGPAEGPAASVASADSGMDAKSKTAVANVRKGHSAVDKAKREWSATVAQSAEHPNTQGCKFEAELKTAIDALEVTDAKLCRWEAKFLNGQNFTDQEIAEAAAVCNALKEDLKSGNKKAAAI